MISLSRGSPITEKVLGSVEFKEPDIRQLSQAEQRAKAYTLARSDIIDEQFIARRHSFSTSINEARKAIEMLLDKGGTSIPEVSTVPRINVKKFEYDTHRENEK